MARTSRVTAEQLEKAQKKIQELPVKDTSKTTRDAIAVLTKDIQAALKKGYTLEDIRNILKDMGIPITTSTLKNYMGKKDKKEKIDHDKPKTASPPEEITTQDVQEFVKPDTPDNEL